MIRKTLLALVALALVSIEAPRPAAACGFRDNEIRVRGRTTVRYRLRRRLGDYGPAWGGYGYGRGYGYGAGPAWGRRAGYFGGTGFRMTLGLGFFDEPFLAPAAYDVCPPGAIIESVPAVPSRAAPEIRGEAAPPPAPAAYFSPGPRLDAGDF